VSYSDFSLQTRSKKIILAQLEAKEKLKLFTVHSGTIYKKSVKYFVTAVRVNSVDLVEASTNALTAGEFYYSPDEGILYVRLSDNTDPVANSLYVSYKFFFANIPVNLPHSITTGESVHYDSRIKSIGSLKLELDFEQTGISLETNSSISLENNDGYFDSIFDPLIWENGTANFWSWSDDLPTSEAKLIYKGIITDKAFSPTEVKFTLKDELSKLKQPLVVSRFSALDGEVDNSILDTPKRVVLGKVDNLRTVGVDKTLTGYPITGTISGSADTNLLSGTISGIATSNTINGLGTSFTTQISAGQKLKVITPLVEYSYTVNTVTSNTVLTITGTVSVTFSNALGRNADVENNIVTGTGTAFKTLLSPNDKISLTVNSTLYTYKVRSISSDTSLLLDDEITATFTGVSATNFPEIPYRGKNRSWHIAGHKLREYSVNITVVNNATNITVDNISDIEAGDYVTILGSSYLVKRVSNNMITLNQALATTPVVSDTVTKIPVQSVSVGTTQYIINRDFTVSNTSTDAVINFNSLAEFNVTNSNNPTISFTFTSGSPNVTTSSTTVDLSTILSPRDWIRAKSITTPTWYEVLSVNTSSLVLRVNATANFTGTIQYKKPDFINDDSLVTVSCLGLESGSTWIRYPSQVVKWVLDYSGLTNQDAASFTQAAEDCKFLMSLYYPKSIGSEIPALRDIITEVNKSVFGSLFLNNSFNYTYNILNADKPESLTVVKDEDIINFSVTTKTNIINSLILKYGPYVDLDAQVETFKTIIADSAFVNEAVESKQRLEVTSYLYKLEDAQIISERWLFFRSLTQSVVSLNAKLNFSLNTLNDVLLLDLSRLYKRFGSSSKRKVGIINSISKNGDSTSVQINDLGNVFSRVPAMAPDTAADYLAGAEEVDRYGYILDNQTETPDITSELELGTTLIG
jgi:hypothetical protein